MKKVIALIVSLILLFAFTIGCKPAETPMPETPTEPPELVVVPSGTSYVYMVPDVRGLYFYYGYWYLFYEDRWYRSTMYNGPWTYIEIALVPLVVVNILPDYIYHIPLGYYRIHYLDLYRNWRMWDRSRHWHNYVWYKHEWRRYTDRYKPRGDIYKPKGQAYKPKGQAYKPKGQAYKPKGQAYKPGGQAYKPKGQAYKPKGQAYKPKGQAYKPGGQSQRQSTQKKQPKQQGQDRQRNERR